MGAITGRITGVGQMTGATIGRIGVAHGIGATTGRTTTGGVAHGTGARTTALLN